MKVSIFYTHSKRGDSMEATARKLNLSVNMEKPKSLQQLTKEELYKSLRESYQVIYMIMMRLMMLAKSLKDC